MTVMNKKCFSPNHVLIIQQFDNNKISYDAEIRNMNRILRVAEENIAFPSGIKSLSSVGYRNVTISNSQLCFD